MNLTDSHLHFDTFAERGEIDGLIQRARDAGVRYMVAIGGSVTANRIAAQVAADHPGVVRAAVGYDRDEAGRSPPADDLNRILDAPGIAAIGETGLDYHYGADSAPQQRALFQQMLDLATARRLPVVVHSRDADQDTLSMLTAHAERWAGDPGQIGVLHCFTEDLEFAERLLDIGMHISFSGIVTFAKLEALREVARRVPEDRLLIETDAPYLAPVPFRGKKNEPAFVVHVAEVLADARDVAVEEIARTTTSNARALFGFTSEDESG